MKRMMLAGAATLLATAMPLTGAAGATAVDGAGDFVGTYTGAANGDLDILGVSAYFDGINYRLSADLNGPVGTTPNSLFVFGINRGAGTERLTFGMPPVGQGVKFDAVAVLFPDGLGRIATFPAMGPPTITPLPGAVTVSGNSITGLFSLALLPSRGFPPEQYTFALWSRNRVNPALDGLSSEIADFAPGITASVPEPATWATMICGFGLAGLAMRRRRVRDRLSAA